MKHITPRYSFTIARIVIIKIVELSFENIDNITH